MDDRARLLKQAPLIHVNQLTAVPLILQQRNFINGGVSINRRIASQELHQISFLKQIELL